LYKNRWLLASFKNLGKQLGVFVQFSIVFVKQLAGFVQGIRVSGGGGEPTADRRRGAGCRQFDGSKIFVEIKRCLTHNECSR